CARHDPGFVRHRRASEWLAPGGSARRARRDFGRAALARGPECRSAVVLARRSPPLAETRLDETWRTEVMNYRSIAVTISLVLLLGGAMVLLPGCRGPAGKKTLTLAMMPKSK